MSESVSLGSLSGIVIVSTGGWNLMPALLKSVTLSLLTKNWINVILTNVHVNFPKTYRISWSSAIISLRISNSSAPSSSSICRFSSITFCCLLLSTSSSSIANFSFKLKLQVKLIYRLVEFRSVQLTTQVQVRVSRLMLSYRPNP